MTGAVEVSATITFQSELGFEDKIYNAVSSLQSLLKIRSCTF